MIRKVGRKRIFRGIIVRALECTYNLMLNTLGCGALPFLKSRSGDDPLFWKGRLGHFEIESENDRTPRIWCHAASVGEVTGAIPIIAGLHEHFSNGAIFLTVATPQGFRYARQHLPSWAVVLPFPLEFKKVLERAFQNLRPDVYVALESEFWPNLFRLLEENRVPAVLLNGRLSERSTGWYRLFNPLFRPIFRQFHWLSMLSEQDRRNVLKLGAFPHRTLVFGSSKYDGLAARVQPQKAQLWRKTIDIAAGTPVIVGGSLRRSECIQLLKVFRSIEEIEPKVVGIFAPRHMEQIANMVQYLKSRSVSFHLLSELERSCEPRKHSVVLVDRIGILFDLYALGDLVFCGGTLEPIGGHNILEPAAWGKPVFYGPHLQKVYNEHSILQSMRGSFLIQDARELLDQWSYWIYHLKELKAHGQSAKDALGKLEGASKKQVELVIRALGEADNLLPGIPGPM